VSGSSVTETFSAHAPEYTALRRRLVPGFDAFYRSAIDALRLPEVGPVRRVLDLGAGTGLLSACVAEAFPEACLELLDGSEAMLAEAVERLGDRLGAVHVQDMTAGLPAGPFDAVVSALAIHHLEDSGKRELFAAIHDRLRPGGVFVNAEQVAGPTAALEAAYQARWAADCRSLGATEAEIEDARERRRHDRSVDVVTQLAWMAEAGFATVDCLYKDWSLATLVGVRAHER
jgi:tRNA (cmo5U34)-methyltransferase